MNKTVLVTGGTGFIGSAFVERLLNEGYNVIALDNDSRNTRSIEHPNLITLRGDVTNYISWCACKPLVNIKEKISAVYHLAFVNGTANFYNKPEHVIDVGLYGTLNAIRFCMENDIKEFVYMSSSEVYGTPEIIPTPETAPCIINDVYNPRFSCGGTKLMGEIICANHGKYFDKMIIVRPHHVYGPGMGYDHLMSEIIKKILLCKNGEVEFQGTGQDTRTFCHIQDFIDGMMLVLNNGKHLNTYNIGHPTEYKIIEILAMINGTFKNRIKFVSTSTFDGAAGRRCPDISKLEELGFKPKIKIRDGLRELKEYIEKDMSIEFDGK